MSAVISCLNYIRINEINRNAGRSDVFGISFAGNNTTERNILFWTSASV